jgi:hypothetical protein
MRVGVDETGDFSPTSITRNHFCVAVEARDGSIERFRQWESSVGPNARENGEVKGRRLAFDELLSFVSDVLEKDPAVRLRPVFVRPADEGLETIALSREATTSALKAGAQALSAEGDPKMARQAQQCADWISALNASDFLWLNVMTTCVGASLYDVLLDARAGGYIGELNELKILVDQRTIRARNLAGQSGAVQAVAWFFRMDSGQAFERVGDELRLIEDTHPLARRWRSAAHQWRVVEMIESVCDFSARSDRTPEIRMADIAAAIFARGAKNEGRGLNELVDRCVALTGGSSAPSQVRLGPPQAPPQGDRATKPT